MQKPLGARTMDFLFIVAANAAVMMITATVIAATN